MFFTKFDPLTKEYVEEKIGAAPAAAGKSCPCLAGMKFAVKLEGEFAPKTLKYEIKDEKTLKVKEGNKSWSVSYAAISQGPITILTHLIPGTDRGWHLVIDKRTWAVTAFETWFGISVPVGGSLYGDRKPDHFRDIQESIKKDDTRDFKQCA